MKAEDSKQSAIALIREIIRSEMDLEDDQIVIYNQNWLIPTSEGIFLSLQFLGGIPYSNRSEMDATGAIETQNVCMQEMYQVKIMSRNSEALFRKHEALMAIASQYSQQIQEANSFRIAPISHGFTDISEPEGVGRLNIYVMTIAAITWYSKQKAADYYDEFEFEARTDKIEKQDVDQTPPS